MSKKLRNILITIGLIILSFWIGTRYERFMTDLEQIGKPVYKREQIYFPDKKETIYLKSKNWGLTGDHKITVISTNPDYEFYPDSISEYIFHGFGGLIYKKSNDTLYIYDGQSPKKPTNFDSKINIVIEKTQGREWRNLDDKIKNDYRKFE
jgi:hypothetical protein